MKIGLVLFTKEDIWSYLREIIRYLPSNYTLEAERIVEGQYLYAKGQYQASINLLREGVFSDPNYRIWSRTTNLQSHYELGERDWLVSQLDTLIRFVRRQQTMTQAQKEIPITGMKLFKELINSHVPEKKLTIKKLNILKGKIEQTLLIDNRIWILAKVNESLEHLNAD